MRSRVAFVGVALALAAGVWWATASRRPGGSGSRESADGADPGAATTSPGAAAPAALDASPKAPNSARTEPTKDKPAGAAGSTGTLVLRGRLLGRDGKPLVSARVRAVDVRHREGGAGAAATTGADGSFSIEGLAAGDYELWTDDGSGDRLAMANAAAGSAEQIELTREDAPPKGTLVMTGRLLDDTGKPIGGARVRVVDSRPWPGAGPRPGVLSAEDGTFTIPDLPSASYSIWANDDAGERKFAFAPAGMPAFDMKPIKAKTVADFKVGPKVLVLDAEGHPVPKAEIFYRHMARRGVSFGSYGEMKDGAFWRNPNDAGVTYEIYAPRSANGRLIASGPFVYEPAAQKGDGDETVRLPSGKTIEGRVTGPDGAGMFGVEIVAITSATGEAKSGASMSRVHGRALTAADGRFALVSLGTGRYRIEATPLPPHLMPPAIEAVAGTTGVEFRVAAGLEAEVRVLDLDGKPVAAASVIVSDTSDVPTRANGFSVSKYSFPRGTTSQISDANGVVRFSQLDPATTYALSVAAFRRDDLRRYEASPWAVGPTTVRLARAWRLHGVVKRPDGATAEAIVFRRGTDGAWTIAASSESDGKFSIGDLGPGPWTLAATQVAGPRGPEVVVSDPSSDVVLTLDATAK